MSWPWSELGLDGPAPLEEVRRAYAQRVKEVHPEEDPEGFQRLHTAYQEARQAARRVKKGGQTSGGAQKGPRSPLSESRQETPDTIDFTALLHQETTQQEAAPEPTEPRLDFDALLRQEEPSGEPQNEKQKESWDFRRIFHEEDTRRAEQRQRTGGGQDESLHRALELMELLFQEERSLHDWERFLASPVFFRVKWDPRFMAALAESFRTEPVLDEKIRETVCGAYGLKPDQVPEEQRAFYEAVSGHAMPAEGKREQKSGLHHPWLTLLVMLFLAGAGVMLLRLVLSLVLWLFQLPEHMEAADIAQYIEEDIGYPVESLHDTYTSSEVFRLPVQQLTFTAWPDGERDLSQGELGYGTDLGNRFLTQAIQAFAEEWNDACDVEMLNEEGSYLTTGKLPEIYVISTDLLGGTDCLTALAEELAQLSQENWYQLWRPAFQIRLEVWEMPYFTYHSSDGPFPKEEILARYQDEFPAELVTTLVETSGLAGMDFPSQTYHLENPGTMTLWGDTYLMMGGVEEASGRTARLYFYNRLYLISEPADTFDPDVGSLEYAHFHMGNSIPTPDDDDLPWPRIGVYRN